MATKYTEVKTTGSIEWAKIFETNRDMTGYDDTYVPFEGAYTVQQILSKDEYTKLQAAGTQKKPNQKRLMDGELMLKFERKHKITSRDGKVIPQAGGAPKVMNADGTAWDKEVNGLIGNGSTAEVTNLITTFKGGDGKMYSRTTMTEVKIIEHIPVEEKENSNEMGW